MKTTTARMVLTALVVLLMVLGAPGLAFANGPKPPPVGSGDMDIEPPTAPLAGDTSSFNGPTPPPAGSGDMDIEPPTAPLAGGHDLIHEHHDEEIPPFWAGWLGALLDAIPSF